MSTHGVAGTLTADELQSLANVPVYTSDGEKFGLVGEFWVDEDTGAPRYLRIGRGLLGQRAVFVPLEGATRTDDGLRVPYTAEQLDGSPEFEDRHDFDLDEAHERRFGDYYGGLGTLPGMPGFGAGFVGIPPLGAPTDEDAALARDRDPNPDVGRRQGRLRRSGSHEPV